MIFVLLSITASPSYAAQANASQSINDIKLRLNAAQSSETLNAEQRDFVVQLYQKTIDNLTQVTEDRNQTQGYIDQVANATSRLADIQRQLDQTLPQADTSGKLALLEKRLLNQQASLLELRSEETGINARILTGQQDVSLLIESALQKQSTAEVQLAERPESETSELAKARRAFNASESDAANARVELLRQRLISRDSLLEILDLQQRLVVRKIDIANQAIGKLQDAVSSARRNQADAVAERALQHLAQLENAEPDIKAIAKDNAELASDIAQITARTDELLNKLVVLRDERTYVERYANSMAQQLAITGADRLSSLGGDLLAQRQQFFQRSALTLKPKALNEELARAQLSKLRLEDRQYLMTKTELSGLNSQRKELHDQQTQLLQDGIKIYRRYIEAIMITRSENIALTTKTAEYVKLLNSRLLWIPSATPLWAQLKRALEQDSPWLDSLPQWQENTLSKNIQWDNKWQLFLLAIPGLILLLKPRLLTLLKTLATNVDKVNRDHFSYTAAALFISLVLASPGPLTLGFLAILTSEGGTFTQQIHQGLKNAAGLWLLLNIFREICRADGVAEFHFKWRIDILAVTRKNLAWLTITLVFVSLFIPIADHSSDGNTIISQLLFGISSLALAYVAHRVLWKLFRFRDRVSRQQTTVKHIAHSLAVCIPLILLGLSWYGYHFSALMIQNKLFISACLLALLFILYSLTLRIFSVIERRMTLERLHLKRQAEQAQNALRQAADNAGEGLPETIEATEYDMDTISQQTRGFLGLLAGVAAIVLVWRLWAEILPALSILNNIELWHVTGDNPAMGDKAITLADGIIAIIMMTLTYLGARNLPGILEISILRKLQLEAGSSYAITTVVKYIIVMVGIIVSLNIIGAQWSKLQWLVAALGVGLGFGLQEIVANFVSGLLILFERPIRVGDTVTVGNHTGTVTRIRIRATTLTDWDRKEQIIPNKTFITEQLTNWTLSDSITRQIIKVGVAYGSDVIAVHKLLSKVIEDNRRITKDPPPSVFFVGFGDSSLNFELRVFVPSMLDIMPLIHEIHVEIEATLRKHEIEIPFPQRDIWIRSEGEQ
ncbi:mechanosensitive ion channel domain-containing protein [uncultured Zhongshania sp.]|uniref:mechanosensitive ion channel domain-containing protein n=1 Tax=uncultured Zhongshania sp. TaxID=1642288 RepID=UPI0025F130E3|nr:mechanosensitive ion channel domain-containing protein [uncultured Zhongshania sp.]